jgi:hypothetical protein
MNVDVFCLLVYDSIYDFIQQWEDSWPLADSSFPEDPTLIIQAITNGMATMVSDGSYKPFLSTEIGAAAWILECSVTQASCFGECSTTGTRKEVNAYRCEVQGCHAGLLGLLALAIHHQIQGGSVDCYFDNDAGLNQSAACHLSVSMKLKHGDLIQAIRQIVHRLYDEHSISVQFRKVKGHKADFIPFDQLSRPEKLNKLMDTRAKARVEQIFNEQIAPPPNTLKFEGWSLWIDDTKCTSDPAKQIL